MEVSPSATRKRERERERETIPKPPRSRLEPHATLIEEMRRRGWTYREIARVLAENAKSGLRQATYIAS